DILQLHVVDPEVPIEDSIGALSELQAAGKIRHIGLCNVDVDELQRAQRVAPVLCVQNRFNILQRGSEPVLQECERTGLAFLPYAPLLDGELERAFPGEGLVLRAIAASRGATVAQLCLAWLLAHSPVTLPIPGTSSIAHLDENLAALELQFDEAEKASIDALAPYALQLSDTHCRSREATRPGGLDV
ncbi:aldo/keto reductase, partial [Sinomonas sp. G460-2]|uniref:aldo/keto reductase n=1 Tax=Sinomonas sp. G460-2 TaxID=3393464 RepID=UPI0039EFEE46